MSKIYSQDVSLIKRKNSFMKGFATFLAMLLVANIVFWSGVGISYLLSSKGFTWFRSNKINVNSVNYYAIIFGDFDTESEALECSIWTSSSGGGAYVFEESTFAVVGMIYESIDDANLVISNFSEDLTYSPVVKQYKSTKFSFIVENVSPADKKDIEDVVGLIKTTVDKTLLVSNKIDTNVLSNVSASSEINSIKSEIKIAKSSIDAINSSYNNQYLTELSKYLTKAEDTLDICINKLLTSENYSGVCKYCACELFFNFYNLSKNIVK